MRTHTAIQKHLLQRPGLAIAGFALFFLSQCLLTAQGSTNHGGQDWTPANGSTIWGDHSNINHFNLPAGYIVYIKQYDGSDPSTGTLNVYAKFANVAGTISGVGAGYGGGGGGGGGGGADSGGAGSAGAGGAGTLGGSAGGAGVTPGDGPGGRGGDGGLGGGTAAGAGGVHGTRGESDTTQAGAGGVGQNGGYLIAGGNGDPNSNDYVYMGSGGGGGGGGGGGHSVGVNTGGGGGGGGGAGGRGGGQVEIRADYSVTMTGTIDLSGTLAGNGHAGGDGSANGGNGGAGGVAVNTASSLGGAHGTRAKDSNGLYSGPGGDGGDGGDGSGGGVLLYAPAVAAQGTVRSLGGYGSAGNGGSLKVRYGSGGLTTGAATYVGAALYNQFTGYPLQPPVIYFSPPMITVANADQNIPNQTLHYTVDGTDPTLSSPTCTGPITLTPGVRVLVRSFAPGWPDGIIQSASLPPNDSFANRTPVSAVSANASSTPIYDNTYASKEGGESNHAGNGGGHSLWWEWTALYSTPVKVFTESANVLTNLDFDTLLAAYSGTSLAQLTSVASNDDQSPGNHWSMVTFQAVGGNEYQIAVDGKNNATGLFRLRIIQEPPLALTDNFTIGLSWADQLAGTVSAMFSCLVQNFGTAASGPLEVKLIAQHYDGAQLEMTNFLVAPAALAPGAQTDADFSAVLMAPVRDWTYFIVLEEQFVGQWNVQDALQVPPIPDTLPAIIGPDDGPPVLSAGGNPGGLWHPVALTNKTIIVTNVVIEGQTYSAVAKAFFDNNTSCNFSNTPWTTSLPSVTVNTNGVLQVGSVASNANMTISAPYVYQGSTGSITSASITVIALGPPALSSLALLPGPAPHFTIHGVPNRRHAIQTSINLVQWTNLTTCVLDPNGNFTVFDTNAPGPQRFYRALELP